MYMISIGLTFHCVIRDRYPIDDTVLRIHMSSACSETYPPHQHSTRKPKSNLLCIYIQQTGKKPYISPDPVPRQVTSRMTAAATSSTRPGPVAA